MSGAVRREDESSRPAEASALAQRMLENVETVVHGKREEVALVLAALACEGHVLLEDVPGTAKTVLARSIAQTIEGATVTRIQCTPDLQPADVTGLSIYNQKTRDFEFRPGPVFANVVLVDEINRAMPKTQSALLEAMAERQVTVDGVTRPLPAPFLVIATENPIEQEGTFPLPEAQLDRFTIRTVARLPAACRGGSDRPGAAARASARHARAGRHARTTCARSSERSRTFTSTTCSSTGSSTSCGPRGRSRASRPGASVRGSLALERTARGRALLHEREFVVPEDVDALFLPVLGHRILLTTSFLAEIRGLGRDAALERIRERSFELAPRPEPDWHEREPSSLGPTAT